MELIFNYDYNTRNDVDVLVRVYENQSEKFLEGEQCVGEVGYNLGVLTSVSENFNRDLQRDLQEQGLLYTIGE